MAAPVPAPAAKPATAATEALAKPGQFAPSAAGVSALPIAASGQKVSRTVYPSRRPEATRDEDCPFPASSSWAAFLLVGDPNGQPTGSHSRVLGVPTGFRSCSQKALDFLVAPQDGLSLCPRQRRGHCRRMLPLEAGSGNLLLVSPRKVREVRVFDPDFVERLGSWSGEGRCCRLMEEYIQERLLLGSENPHFRAPVALLARWRSSPRRRRLSPEYLPVRPRQWCRIDVHRSD